MTPYAGVLVAAAVLGPLVVSVASLEAFQFPQALLLRTEALLLLAAGVVAACEGRTLRLRGALRDPVAGGFVALLVSAAVSSHAGGNGWSAIEGAEERFVGLAAFGAWTVVFFAARAAAADPALCFGLVWACFAGAVGAGAYAVCQLAGLDAIAWHSAQAVAGPGGTLGLPNFLGEHLAVALPLGVPLARRAISAGRRGAAAMVAAAMLLGVQLVVLSLARGAWLALAAGGAVLLAFEVRQKGFRRAVPALCVLALSWLPAGAFIGLSERGESFRSEASAVVSSVARLGKEHRLEYWRAAVLMLSERPWLGVGPAAFHLHFPRFQRAAHARAEWNGAPREAHNEILQLAATQGAIGLGALVLLASGLLLGLRRVSLRARDPDETALLAALAAGLAAFGTAALVSPTVVATGSLVVTQVALVSALAFVPRPEREVAGATAPSVLGGLIAGAGLAGALLFLVNALAVGGAEKPAAAAADTVAIAAAVLLVALAATRTESAIRGPTEPRAPRARRSAPALALRAVAAACGIFAVVQWVAVPFRADALARRGQQLLLAGSPAAALPFLEAATALTPHRARLWSELGVARHEAAGAAGSPSALGALLERAREAHERAVALEPGDARSRAALARAVAEAALLDPARADRESALALFDDALGLAPRDPILLADAARSSLALGFVDRGQAYAQRALAVAPDHAPARAALGMAAMLRGDFAAAARELEAARSARWRDDAVAEATGLANLAATRLALGDPSAALEAADAALARVPDYEDARRTRAAALTAMGWPATLPAKAAP